MLGIKPVRPGRVDGEITVGLTNLSLDKSFISYYKQQSTSLNGRDLAKLYSKHFPGRDLWGYLTGYTAPSTQGGAAYVATDADIRGVSDTGLGKLIGVGQALQIHEFGNQLAQDLDSARKPKKDYPSHPYFDSGISLEECVYNNLRGRK